MISNEFNASLRLQIDELRDLYKGALIALENAHDSEANALDNWRKETLLKNAVALENEVLEKEVQQLKADKAELVEGMEKIRNKAENTEEFGTEIDILLAREHDIVITDIFEITKQLLPKHKENG